MADSSNTMTSAADSTRIFARLVACNQQSILAMNAASGTEHHQKFVDTHGPDRVPCFVMSLQVRPLRPELGWIVGCGKQGKESGGVDFLLHEIAGDDDVSPLHAYFAWHKGDDNFGYTPCQHRDHRLYLDRSYASILHLFVLELATYSSMSKSSQSVVVSSGFSLTPLANHLWRTVLSHKNFEITKERSCMINVRYSQRAQRLSSMHGQDLG